MSRWTTLMAILTLVVLLTMKNLWRTFPTAFYVLCITTFVAWYCEIDQTAGISLVKSSGAIPAGLPGPSNIFSGSFDWSTLLSGAALIAVLGYMESASVAKKFEGKSKMKVSLPQELLALGVANLMGAFFRAYPTTGSLSRTGLNFQVGSKSPFSSFFVAIIVGTVLLFLTSVIGYIPNCVLAAIVISAALNLITYEEPLYIAKTNPFSLLPLLITFIATLLIGPEYGVIIAIALSLIEVVWRTARPQVRILGRLAGTTTYKDQNRFENLIATPGIIVLRVEAKLYFVNNSHFLSTMSKAIKANKAPVHAVVIDAEGIISIDPSACHALTNVISTLSDKKIMFLWANVKISVKKTMDKSHLTDQIKEDHFFSTVHEAVQYAESTMSQPANNGQLI
eukprot:TRINITY_DN3513_c0_g2_i7.p1 TRINITY_DN3513_c0_g2~~TRINITY_DN3513_c0_g2_i7.p1  ORF type:complete len:395 (+),score=59.61 TRINITY_DN3513_c0_g2_i7:722-1906(+)